MEFNALYGVPFCTPQAPLSQWRDSVAAGLTYRRLGSTHCSATLTFNITESWKFTAGVRASHIEYSGDLVYYGPFLSPTAGTADTARGHRLEQ